MSKLKDGFWKDKGILSDSYVLLAAGGHHSWGNASGDIPISNGTLCVNLNADKIDGYDLSQLYWANIQVQTSSDSTKQPTFGKVTISGSYPHVDMYSDSAESSIYFRPNSGTSWAIGKAPWGVGGFGIGILGDGCKFTILDNGNVGIGTTSPSNKLHVYGGNGVKIEGDSGGPYLTVNYNSRYDSDNSLDNYGINLIKFGKSSMDNYLGTGLNTGNSGHFGRQSYVLHTGADYAFGFYSSGWKCLAEIQGDTGNVWTRGWIYAYYLHSRYNLYVQNVSYFGRDSYGDTYYIDGPHYTGSAAHLLINYSTWDSNWYWDGKSGQPTWLWGSNDGVNMYVWNPSNFDVYSAAYIRSMGDATIVTGRNFHYDGAYTYRSYGGAANSPTTYACYIGFGHGSYGSAEIGVEWTGNHGIWYRSAGDWQDWSAWRRIYDDEYHPYADYAGYLTDFERVTRVAKDSSNNEIESVTGWRTYGFIQVQRFCPPEMYRTTEDMPAPYGIGFGNGSESGGIMPVGSGDYLRDIIFYGANSGPTIFRFGRQIWEGSSYDSRYSNRYETYAYIDGSNGIINTSHSFRINGYGGNYHSSNNISGLAGEIWFGGNFHLDSQNGYNMYLNYYTGATVSIAQGGGYVGIGTDSPSQKLDVRGNINIGNGGSETHIYASTSNFNNAAISFYDDTSGWGTMVAVGGGGCTVVGAGESAHEFAPNVRDENLYLTADTNVNIFTNLDGGYSSRRHAAQFTTGGDTYLYGNLYLGANDYNNFIAFYGNYGDANGSYVTSFIGEHLWGGSESTELLLMKFNDSGNGTDGTTAYGSGPDRIRHLAHAHVFQIMTDTSQGDFVTMANSSSVETKFDIARNIINSYVPILQQNNNSWLSPARVQIGRLDTTSYSDRSCIGTTDGNLHIDPYSGHSLYLNYYCNATTYFNGSSYWINTSGQSNMSIAHLLINGATWWSDWYWSGQGGQPTWLWGSNDGVNMYVWNPSNFSVNYANYSNWAHYLAPHYDGGDQPNPQQYFNEGIGVKVAMTRYATICGTTCWWDTLWVNGYTGGDVPYMNALTFARNGEPKFVIHSQSNRSTSYGTYYEVASGFNTYVTSGYGYILYNYITKLYPIASNPDNSHPGYGINVFYSWNTGQAGNSSSGYSNGITIGSHPGDQAYGWQLVQNMWDDKLYVRRYNGGWQSWRTLYSDDYHPYAGYADNADMVDGYHAVQLWRSDGAVWNPSANVTLNASGSGQEWSFDIYRNGYSSCYWHVWDSSLGSLFIVYPDSGNTWTQGRSEANGFYHRGYGSSNYFLTSDGGARYWPDLYDGRYYRHFNTENISMGSLWCGYGTGMSTQLGPTSTWWHIFSSGWSDNTWWISQIAVPTADGWDSNHMMYRTYHGSDYGWRTVLDNTNYTSYTDDRYLRYEGWWNSGSGQNVDDSHGMNFTYTDHGAPRHWGVTVTFECERGSAYRLQLHGTGDNYLYFRNRSADYGGWHSSGWKQILTNQDSYVSGSWGWINGTRIDWTEGSDRAAHLLINGNTWWSNWYWDGRGGSPTWIWGSNDYGSNNYLYYASNIISANLPTLYWANQTVSTGSNSGTWPTFGSAYVSDWFRCNGSCGIYWQSYGGGIWMYDSSWIRTYGSKNFYVEGGNFAVSGSAGIGTTSPSYKLHVEGDGYFTNILHVSSAAENAYPNYAAIEVRERSRGTTGITHNYANAPRIGFHWGDRYWANLTYFDGWFRDMTDSCGGYVGHMASCYSLNGYTSNYVGSSWAIAGYAGSLYFGGNFHIDSQNGYNIYLNYYSEYNTYINPRGGNVGIGTDGPAQKLHVSNGLIRVTNNGQTLTMGSANAYWCHFESTVDFYFGNQACFTGHVYPYSNNTYNLGEFGNYWHNVNAYGFVHRSNPSSAAVPTCDGGWTWISSLGGGISGIDINSYNDDFYPCGYTSYSGSGITTLKACSSFHVNSAGAYHTSDISLKHDIRDILYSDVIQLFSTENGFIRHYKWNDTNKDSYGFIAQELQEYCPEAVDICKRSGLYTVNYNVAFAKIIGAMFKKIKELERRLEEKERLDR